jgi:YidC/Oxa1 family membrane protein insertase
VDRNFALALGLSFLVLMLWTMFTESTRPPDPAPPIPLGESSAADDGEQKEIVPEPVLPELGVSEPAPLVEDVPVAQLPEEQIIEVQSPLYSAEFTTHGGGLLNWRLKDYDVGEEFGGAAVDMVTFDPEQKPTLATPFDELGFGDLSRSAYSVEQPDSKTLVFTREQGGVRVRKTYLFEEGRYLFRLRLELENGSDRQIRATFRTRWPAALREENGFKDYSLVTRADGSLEQAPVGSGPSMLGLFGGGSLEELREYPSEVDWAGAQSRYFLAALISDFPREAGARFTPLEPGVEAMTELAFQAVNIPPGQRAERELQVYLGPKIQSRLEEVGAHLDEAILKGWFPSLTRFFIWLLGATYSVVPNYGVAIIIVTIMVRLLMAPVMARQMKSMKKMGALQPKMKEVQEKYGDDRQKQSEAMMAVYREAGMSPFSAMAGCFPMLLQLPVFIGLYYALQGAIELRQEPFMLWITDLSAPEALFTIPGLEVPVRLLPLLMGGSMVLQQKMTPTSMDPAQARMMLTIMPIMFTLLFYQFASGLVLYWLVSNLLGILQQVLINRRPAAAK